MPSGPDQADCAHDRRGERTQEQESADGDQHSATAAQVRRRSVAVAGDSFGHLLVRRNPASRRQPIRLLHLRQRRRVGNVVCLVPRLDPRRQLAEAVVHTKNVAPYGKAKAPIWYGRKAHTVITIGTERGLALLDLQCSPPRSSGYGRPAWPAHHPNRVYAGKTITIDHQTDHARIMYRAWHQCQPQPHRTATADQPAQRRAGPGASWPGWTTSRRTRRQVHEHRERAEGLPGDFAEAPDRR